MSNKNVMIISSEQQEDLEVQVVNDKGGYIIIQSANNMEADRVYIEINYKDWLDMKSYIDSLF